MALPLIGVGLGIAARVGGRFALRAAGKGLKFLGSKGWGLLKAAVPAAIGGLVVGGLKLGASGAGDAMSAVGAANPFLLLGAVAAAFAGAAAAQSYGMGSPELRGRGKKAFAMPG
ncbi:hypothetical protein [Nocardiopsis coralliicola]